jgi:hypothetical protein
LAYITFSSTSDEQAIREGLNNKLNSIAKSILSRRRLSCKRKRGQQASSYDSLPQPLCQKILPRFD